MIRQIAIFLLFLLMDFQLMAQENELQEPHTHLTSIDIATRGIGLSRQQMLNERLALNFTTGIGGGYNFSSDVIAVQWLSNPAAHLLINPRFYYNNPPAHDGRIHLRANYLGLQGKLSSGSLFSSKNRSRSTAMIEAHAGLQTESEKFLFNYHFGVGHGFDLGTGSSGWYIALNLRLGLRISRQQNREESN
jgi:hypothetical protein